MSNQYGPCSRCKKDILISCTNGDWQPAMYHGEPICEQCYDELKDADLTAEGYY